MYSLKIREEELKLKVAKDFFSNFDTTKIIENIDFCVIQSENLFKNNALLWAEAKASNKADIYESFVQLILTIGKAKIHEKQLPPEYLGAFDSEKIAFLPYNEIANVFTQNDFNWQVRPSDHESKEFKQLYAQSKEILTRKSTIFNFFTKENEKNKDLERFIKNDFIVGWGKGVKIGVTKNNFNIIYQQWLTKVKPSIKLDYKDENGRIKELNPADFYLADLLSKDNESLKDNLEVILKKDHYEKTLPNGFELSFKFKDEQKAHHDFWHNYERPPRKEVQNYILQRRDLLVPQDIRERKGAFFTPQIWVQKAQEYLAKSLGEDYQEEYFIWDLAAGTGNLLANLQNKKQIFASTLDEADVKIMKDDAKKGLNNLFEKHIFQFDFLNDELFDEVDKKGKLIKKSKIPDKLQEILKDEEKRKKLLIFINPPYAEATSATQVTNTGKNKDGVAITNKTYEKYKNIIGKASNEIFAQFFIRIYKEISGAKLGEFSKLKILQASNFSTFRTAFAAKLLSGFICPAATFDNVKGEFPIGFLIWDLAQIEEFKKAKLRIFDKYGKTLGKKTFYSHIENQSLQKWWVGFKDDGNIVGLMVSASPDFQHNGQLTILSQQQARYCLNITANNLIPFSIYFAVRHCIKATWLNDRDQFLYPKDEWKKDKEFHNDCLAFTLFHGQNRISSKEGANHFIPFDENEIRAKDSFSSHFMFDFMNAKITSNGIFNQDFIPSKPLKFSKEAKAVFEAGKELFSYYHEQEFTTKAHKGDFAYLNEYNANASLYNIKAYFQGFNDKGKMNSKSLNPEYNARLSTLKNKLEILAQKIALKVYEYGFLKE
ncbi:hypothetical protein DMB95_05940 [Campylobacter sp. MIT 12-8780]|uniref:hypothetical protein n=1 Tax=Campylobacter sp. MIT 12-8780 TaxID=2202200 RepID=UPI00115D0AE0|nr:hypothetical protein [Campylobacter sp. MIT 12-8780]TQR41027.1 hypothetical protein DMB95_05940 [Campylobacter sp. MIT 12-8780]